MCGLRQSLECLCATRCVFGSSGVYYDETVVRSQPRLTLSQPDVCDYWFKWLCEPTAPIIPHTNSSTNSTPHLKTLLSSARPGLMLWLLQILKSLQFLKRSFMSFQPVGLSFFCKTRTLRTVFVSTIEDRGVQDNTDPGQKHSRIASFCVLQNKENHCWINNDRIVSLLLNCRFKISLPSSLHWRNDFLEYL